MCAKVHHTIWLGVALAPSPLFVGGEEDESIGVDRDTRGLVFV